jgi:hypothetical protein
MDFSIVARVSEVLASEEAGGGDINPFIIGGFGLLVLIVLLIITLTLNVDR